MISYVSSVYAQSNTPVIKCSRYVISCVTEAETKTSTATKQIYNLHENFLKNIWTIYDDGIKSPFWTQQILSAAKNYVLYLVFRYSGMRQFLAGEKIT